MCVQKDAHVIDEGTRRPGVVFRRAREHDPVLAAGQGDAVEAVWSQERIWQGR